MSCRHSRPALADDDSDIEGGGESVGGRETDEGTRWTSDGPKADVEMDLAGGRPSPSRRASSSLDLGSEAARGSLGAQKKAGHS